MTRTAPITHQQQEEKLEPGFRKIKTLVAGYRGFPKNAEIDVYHTEAEKMVSGGIGQDVTPSPTATEPAEVAEPEQKELDAPPADKSMKSAPKKK